MQTKRQMFIFWQFNGDNSSWCNLKCPYCHIEGTPVLMADLTWKPIEEIKVGDLVVGYEYTKNNSSQFFKWHSKVVKVINTFNRSSQVVELKTEHVTTYCTPEHKWLTTKRGKNGYRETQYLTEKLSIRFISKSTVFVEDEDYKNGWLNGILRGDGCVQYYPENPKTKYYFRLAVKDHDILERFSKYTNHNFIEYTFTSPNTNMRAVQSQKKAVHYRMKSLMANWKTTPQFLKGFLAGIFDAEGTYNGNVIRITNTNRNIIGDIIFALSIIGFKPVVERHGKDRKMWNVRLSTQSEVIRFFATVNPAVKRKRDKFFGTMPYHSGSKFISARSIGEKKVFNIETETGNYVANGLISKNCYGGKKQMFHYWNGDIVKWERAFERLDNQHDNTGIYFVMSYGESLGGKGFYECVEMIGRHPTWTLCIVTNWMLDPTRLLSSELAKSGRLFIVATWHPLGVPDRVQGWETFKNHLLQAKAAKVPLHVMYCWYRPQTKWWPEYFKWLDQHDIRTNVRKFMGSHGGFRGKVYRTLHLEKIPAYTEIEQRYLEVSTCPKVVEYRVKLNPTSSKGVVCTAGKDLILVKYDGEVDLCADLCNNRIGNIFDPNFKLSGKTIICPGPYCGGDYGMLHFIDNRFDPLPTRLQRDTFVSLVEGVKQDSPVPYHKRKEMLECLKQLS